MFKNLGAFELLIIVAIVLLLFGGKKIPETDERIGKRNARIQKSFRRTS